MRWAGRGALTVVLAALVAHLVLSQRPGAGRTLQVLAAPHWAWLAAAGAAAVVTHAMGAVALTGATRRPLHFGRTFSVQFAASFNNRLAPVGIGGIATNVRYLERDGMGRSAAIGAVTMNSAATVVVHVVAIAAMVPIAQTTLITHLRPPGSWPLLAAAGVGLAAAAAYAWIHVVPARLIGIVTDVVRDLGTTMRCPRRAARLLGGTAGVTLTYGLALASTLWAFGVHVGLAKVLMVFLVASAVAALSPTPGGVGAVEAALIAGLTSVTGQVAPVVAGVLAYRLITFWLPVLPGAACLLVLRRRQLL